MNRFIGLTSKTAKYASLIAVFILVFSACDKKDDNVSDMSTASEPMTSAVLVAPNVDADVGLTADADVAIIPSDAPPNRLPTPTSPESPRLQTPISAASPRPPKKSSVAPRVSLSMPLSDYPRVDGSTATVPLAAALLETVAGVTADEAAAMVRHTTTSDSFASLAYGEADILLVYDPPTATVKLLEEQGHRFKMEPIGRDALVFLSNEGNPVKNLEPEQIVDIYSGKITNWSDVGGEDKPIIAFQRNKDSGSQALMDKLVMKDTPSVEAPIEIRPSAMGDLLELVADYTNSKNAIGYSVYYYFANMYAVEGVRALSVGGVACDNESIRDKSYPLTQDFYAVIRENEPEDSAASRLFDFVTGDEGAGVIEYAGYVSIRGEAADVSVNTGSFDAGGLEEELSGTPSDGVTARGISSDENIFASQYRGLYGFVDAEGAWALAPYYDEVNAVAIDTENRDDPIYWNCRRYERDSNGVTDWLKPYVTRVIGPGGRTVYESFGMDIDVIGIHKDGSMNAWVGPSMTVSDGGYMVAIASDGVTTTETLGCEEYMYFEAEGDDRWVVKRDGMWSLIDRKGVRVSQNEYADVIITAVNDVFVFRTKDNYAEVVGRDGKVKHRLKDVCFMNPLANGERFAYYDETVSRWGILDKDFEKITEPVYIGVSDASGGRLIVMTDAPGDFDSSYSYALADLDGAIITQKNYAYLSAASFSAYNNGDDANAPLLYEGHLPSEDRGWSDPEYIDVDGNVALTSEGNYIIDGLIGNYIVLRLNPEKAGIQDKPGFSASAEFYRYGMKSLALSDGTLVDSDAELSAQPWILKPEYSRISGIGADYIAAVVEPDNRLSEYANDFPLAKETSALFDMNSGKIAAKSSALYSAFQGCGQNESGDLVAVFRTLPLGDDPSFGLINDKGEPVRKSSGFDTLSADE